MKNLRKIKFRDKKISPVYGKSSQSMKCLIYEMVFLWNVQSKKCPISEMSVCEMPFYEISYLWNVLSMKCLILCLSMKCPNARRILYIVHFMCYASLSVNVHHLYINKQICYIRLLFFVFSTRTVFSHSEFFMYKRIISYF